MNSWKPLEYNIKDKCYVFLCPNCECYTQVSENEVNCQIFRHGVLKTNGQQVNPHASKKECDELVEQNLVYGCCKPFRIFRGKSGNYEYVDICDYI